MSTPPPPSKHTPGHRQGTTEPAVLLEDLTAGLIWPTLLKAPSMAFSPSRWLLGIMAAFMLIVVSAIHAWIFASQSPQPPAGTPESSYGFHSVVLSMMSMNPGYMLGSLTNAVQHHIMLFSQNPWTSAALFAPVLLVLGVFGFAITRSASIEYAHGRQTDAAGALSAALRSIRQIALTTLGPLALCAILAGLVTLIGLTLGIPVVNIAGSALYLLGVILAVLIVCVLTLHIATLPISVSALSIEGTDGFDALQRSYAYLIARPIRLTIYAIILLGLGTMITTIVATLAGWSIELADWLVSSLSSDAGRRVLTGAEDMSATEPFANRVIVLIRSALELIVAGYGISVLFCSTTLGYLCIRRVCDGQDINEVWDPAE